MTSIKDRNVSPSPPVSAFNRSSAVNSSLEIAGSPSMKKTGMHKRKASVQFGYNTNTVTKEYHIVSGREGIGRAYLTVELNEHPSSIHKPRFKVDRHAPCLEKYADRIPIADVSYPPNANRFENINRSPRVHTMSKNLPAVHLDKYTSRE